jgi:transposase
VKTVEQHEQIRRAYHIDRKSIRQIARELHISRRTVDKALLNAQPRPYTLTASRTAPVLGPYKDRIVALLAENVTLRPKQRYTSHKIYEQICLAGYHGSEATVRTFVARQRREQHRPKLFLPLAFDPGIDAQVDWGEAEVSIAGIRQTVQVFVLRLGYSRKLFVRAYPTQKQESFFEAHVHAFHHINGVPHRLSYDNLTTAVKKVLTGHTRQEQTAFTAFRSHYLFDSFFCTVGEGHEKGGVEHAVGFARRNFMVPRMEATSFDDLNAQLLQRCHADDARTVDRQPTTIGAAWQHEQPFLRLLPTRDMPCCVERIVTLTPYSQVVFETNRYSVPVDQALRQLTLRAYPFVIDVLHQERVIATHPRCYGREQDLFDPRHYLPLLEQRPGAFDHAIPMRRWRADWPAIYHQVLEQLRERWPDGAGVRMFVRILRLLEDYPAALLEQAMTHALAFGSIDVDGIRLCLHQLQHPDVPTTPLNLHDQPHLSTIGTQPIDLNPYDTLMGGSAWRPTPC